MISQYDAGHISHSASVCSGCSWEAASGLTTVTSQPVNVHPAKGLTLARLDVFHVVCQVHKVL